MKRVHWCVMVLAILLMISTGFWIQAERKLTALQEKHQRLQQAAQRFLDNTARIMAVPPPVYPGATQDDWESFRDDFMRRAAEFEADYRRKHNLPMSDTY